MSNKMIATKRDRMMMIPYAIAGLIWILAICAPLLFFLKDYYGFSETTMKIGGLLLLNGSVGLLWILGGLKELFFGGLSGMTTAEFAGGTVEDDTLFQGAGGHDRSRSDDSSTSMFNPTTGLEMDGAFDRSGRMLNEH